MGDVSDADAASPFIDAGKANQTKLELACGRTAGVKERYFAQ